MNALEQLRALLCDPEGNVCIHGSDEDRRLIQEALAALDSAASAEPVAWRSSLPYITQEIADDYIGRRVLMVKSTTTESGYDWTQVAVDFAALVSPPAAPSVRVPDALAVPAPFAGTIGYIHERGYAIGWNACRAEVCRLNAPPSTAEPVSSVDYWQKRGYVCKTCGGQGVVRGGSPLHHLGTWAENCPDCSPQETVK